MQTTSLVQELEKIFLDIKNKLPNVQNSGCKALQTFMETHRELSDEIFFRLLELTKSTEKQDILGLFLAVNRIVKAIRETQTLQFVHKFLPLIFQQLSSSEVEIIVKAAQCVGSLIKLGVPHNSESVETQVKAALSWLRTSEGSEVFGAKGAENRKFAAVLVLKEFCLHAPVITFSCVTANIKESIRDLLSSLKDSRQNVREAAFELVKAFLKLISNREESTRKDLYLQIYDKAKTEFNSSDVFALQASLLVVEALLTHSQADFSAAQYMEICNYVFKLKDHKNILIKKTLVVLVPILAAYSTPTFISKYLPVAMTFILEFITKKGIKEKGAGFVALGRLCKILPKDKFGIHVPAVFKLIFDEVIKNKKSFCPEVLDCVEMTMQNYGSEFIKNPQTEQFLDFIFSAGLTEKLIAALHEIISVPSMDPISVVTIQVRLLSAISVVLTHKSFNFSAYLQKLKIAGVTPPRVPTVISKPGDIDGNSSESKIVKGPTPKKVPLEEIKDPSFSQILSKRSMDSAGDGAEEGEEFSMPNVALDKATLKKYSQKVIEAVMENLSLVAVKNETVRNSMIILALRTLSEFDFSEFTECLAQFVQEFVLDFLEDENADIRNAAIKTSCALYIPLSSSNVRSSITRNIERVNDLIERFLIVSITDSDFKIRVKMLKYLNQKFDYLLAQKTNLKLLFQCVQSNVLEVRQQAIAILGRISEHNPSVILPYLRNQLVQLISKLEFAADIREKEEAAKVLTLLMKYSGRMCEPYTEAILNALIPKLRDSSYTSLVPSVLLGIGQLSEVGGEIMKPKLKEIVPLIIENLKDQSNTAKREISLKALTHIVEYTGYAIYPYLHYPQLITLIRQLIVQETSPLLRKAVLKLVGAIGALDPYKVKQIQLHESMSESSDSDIYESCYWLYEDMLKESKKAGHHFNPIRGNQIGSDKKDKDQENKEKITAFLQSSTKTDNISQLNEMYHPTVAIKALMRVLMIPTLKDHHQIVLHASKFILKSLTTDCVPYLPIIIPPLLSLIKTGDHGMVVPFFEFLSELVKNVGESIAEFCPHIFEIVMKFLEEKNSVDTVLELIETLSKYARNVFKNELSMILPKLLQIIHEHNTRPKEQVVKALTTLKEFGELLDEYLHLILPSMVSICSLRDVDPNKLEIKTNAVNVIKSAIRCPHFRDYLGLVVHPLVKQIEPSTYSEYGVKILLTLTQILRTLSVDFAMYLPMIHHVVLKYRIANSEFSQAVGKFLHLNIVDVIMDESLEGPRDPSDSRSGASVAVQPAKPERKTRETKTELGQLMKEFDASKCFIKEDWIEWLKKTSIELLRQSPSPVLYACSSLAQVCDPIATELYNMAFASCWKILNDRQKEYIISNLYRTIESSTAPSVIHQNILNLSEFMEHEESSLPILTATLSSLAERCNALAKALYYREIEFESNPTFVIESLISINYGLQQPEAANGILTYAQNYLNIEMKEEWYQKLHRWEDALRSYQAKLMRNPKADDALIGQMQCLRALSDWEALSKIAEDIWNQPRLHESIDMKAPPLSESTATPGDEADPPLDLHALKPKIAEMAAAAAWNLGKWDQLDMYNKGLESTSYEHLFYDSVLHIYAASRLERSHPQSATHYLEAHRLIEKAREVLDPSLTSLLNESYSRAYSVIIELQMLKELEEVIIYKQSEGNESKRKKIENLWAIRLKHMQKDIDIWQQVLAIRSLVKDRTENVDLHIKYANLCRRNGRFGLSRKVLDILKNELQPTRINDMAKIEFALMKCSFDNGSHREVYEQLKARLSKEMDGIDSKLQARFYLKLGTWEKNQPTIISEKKIDSVINSFNVSTQLNPDYYKAWHAFGLMNYEALTMYEEMKKTNIKSPTRIQQHCLSAINGFIHAISLGGNDITKTLQSLLRFIKLWFAYGDLPEQEELIRDSFEKIAVASWLPVIPQVLARIDVKNPVIRKIMFDLLERIGRHEPQALLYPLCLLHRSTSEERKKSAEYLMNNMRTHSPILMSQALEVCHELIRTALLLMEQWYEAIEEAIGLCYGSNNPVSAVKLLLELHNVMKREPETMNEASFHQYFGSSLHLAESWAKKYLESRSEIDLNQAWDIYYNVYKTISEKLPELQTLELRNVSPKLMNLKDLEIFMPGLYRSGGAKMVTIGGFKTELTVLPSKQHPRKLAIMGSDGREYLFLLKGHEDNRQDERAMQLFGLVNTLLSTDPQTQKKDLSIRRYGVIPLSVNTGIIGWVPNCDTLNCLIKEYRSTYKIYPNIEFKLMKSMCESFQNCCLVNKVEIFRHAMDHTFGQDLYKVLWLKSKNSEIWLERRTNYTRSHAVMCMVGYILGLGDRHPSNLMLDRYSGKIIHIDFGDCFEAAIRREKLPEKVPFRLTRMLIKAMEVSGIEGNYRTTCEQTMRVLRENKDSLKAVLEAFVYDPILSFKLLAPAAPKQSKLRQQKGENGEENEDLFEHYKASKDVEERKKIDEREIHSALDESDSVQLEKLNLATQFVMERITNKLDGKEFNLNFPLDVKQQVDKLIKQATSDENLAQCYIGWCPYW